MYILYFIVDSFQSSMAPADSSKCDDLITQLLTEEDMQELVESGSGLYKLI